MLIITPEALLFAGLLFVLRVVNYAVSTIRLVFIARNRRKRAAALAFMEAFIFAVVMTRVVTDLDNSVINLIAYCLGASAGSYVGMALESRFITSYSTLTIITHDKGQEIAAALRACGYGATVTRGEGRDGEVTIIRCSATNRDVPVILKTVREIHPQAFIEIDPCSGARLAAGEQWQRQPYGALTQACSFSPASTGISLVWARYSSPRRSAMNNSRPRFFNRPAFNRPRSARPTTSRVVPRIEAISS